MKPYLANRSVDSNMSLEASIRRVKDKKELKDDAECDNNRSTFRSSTSSRRFLLSSDSKCM